jgi:tetratricopeptide (TPR) repeat protein
MQALRAVLTPVVLLLFPAVVGCQDLREAARLDAGGKCDEAERLYRSLLARHPVSAALLNNTGNHYLLCGQPAQARLFFEKLLKINPGHVNANLQLARIAVDSKDGRKALEYLARVKETGPAASLLRAEALHWAGHGSASQAILDALEGQSAGDARWLHLLGLACGRLGLYERAERAFNSALALRPGDGEILFQLGRAAARAQHYDRASRALEAALKIRPGDADVLVELGRVCGARQEYVRAVFFLAQARQKAPQNPEISLLMARAAEDAGYYDDAAKAYDDYLRLRPDDDAARRDRARACGHTETRRQEARDELAWYLAKHPKDPLGHYVYAQVFWHDEPDSALDHLTQAAALDPDSVTIRYSRAWMLQRNGQMAESLPDLEAAGRLEPDNARILDLTGMAHLALDRPSEAEKAFRQALARDPESPEIVLHLGRALMALGRSEEAQIYLDKYRKMRPPGSAVLRKQFGMIGLATLAPREQRERAIVHFRREARDHPDHPEFQLHLSSLLLADGRKEEALQEFRVLLKLNASGKVLHDAGAVLLSAGEYALARDFLQLAVEERPAARLGLATALFYADGPARALECLGQAPPEEATGDELLLKASILEALGRRSEAVSALDQGLGRASAQPSVVQRAVLLLVRLDRKQEALNLLEQAIRSNPDDPELPLTRGVVLGMLERLAEAEKAIKEVASRWPEVDRAYIAHGLVLERTGRNQEAGERYRIAAALGSEEPALRCAQSRLAGAPSPGPACACGNRLEQLLFRACAEEAK